MKHNKGAFILIQVLIMTILLSMIAMSLFESAELMAKVNVNWWRKDQTEILAKQSSVNN